MHRERGRRHAVTVITVMELRRFGINFRSFRSCRSLRSCVHANVSHIYVAFGGSPISESNK